MAHSKDTYRSPSIPRTMWNCQNLDQRLFDHHPTTYSSIQKRYRIYLGTGTTESIQKDKESHNPSTGDETLRLRIPSLGNTSGRLFKIWNRNGLRTRR